MINRSFEIGDKVRFIREKPLIIHRSGYTPEGGGDFLYTFYNYVPKRRGMGNIPDTVSPLR